MEKIKERRISNLSPEKIEQFCGENTIVLIVKIKKNGKLFKELQYGLKYEKINGVKPVFITSDGEYFELDRLKEYDFCFICLNENEADEIYDEYLNSNSRRKKQKEYLTERISELVIKKQAIEKDINECIESLFDAGYKYFC